MSAPFSAIMITGALVLPEVIVGMIDASATRKPMSPCTCNSSPTTAIGSWPILHVPTTWQAVWPYCRANSKSSSSVRRFSPRFISKAR